MIYFLRPTDGGPVKIGHSADVEARQRQLESHYGQPLTLLATLPGDRREERAIHLRFAHLRFGQSEQFRPASDLMAFIDRPLLVDPNPDAVEVMPSQIKPLRLAEDVVSDAKVVASLRGISMAEYLSETLRPIVKKALADELRKRVEGGKS